MSDKVTIIPRSEHSVSRENISKHALRVLYQLKQAGFESYLVGGCIRDLLLGRIPKDFDVVTNAGPEEVQALFRNCRLIGRRFRLAHIHFRKEIIEVATFRTAITEPDQDHLVHESGMILRDNVYGTLEQDIWRRDFTVNALYYNIQDFSIVDYSGGLKDLRARVLRIMGEPTQRYQEDPIRMLRALRFAAKLNFKIDVATAQPFNSQLSLLLAVPAIRLYEEIVKSFLCGAAVKVFQLLRAYGFFKFLFPLVEQTYSQDDFSSELIDQSLFNTDERLSLDKAVNPAFVFAALLWSPMKKLADQYQRQGDSEFVACHRAGDDIIKQQGERVIIPRRISYMICDIWLLQLRLQRRTPKRVVRLLEHKRFRAAYDFLLLRSAAGEEVSELAQWWTLIQTVNASQRTHMIKQVQRARHKKASS